MARLKLCPAPMPPQTAGDWDILRQHGSLSRKNDATWLIGHPLGAPVTIGAPNAPSTPPMTLGCYKVDGRMATRLRNCGWTVARIAAEAVIDPQNWTMDGSRLSGLRRKLKRARSSDVTIIAQTENLPITQMTRVANQWAERHGGERGFSMGRYCPRYVAGQQVFLIYQSGALVGFISLQCHGQSWQLDLIRHQDNIRDGAMHLAVVTAIQAAKLAGVTRLSLAAIPDCHLGIGARLEASCKGLTQFKNSFRPQWVPLYHAARARFLFGASLLAVTIAIQRPIGRIIQVFALKLRRWYATYPLKSVHLLGKFT